MCTRRCADVIIPPPAAEAQRASDRGLRVRNRAVDQGNRTALCSDEDAGFGAAEDDHLGSAESCGTHEVPTMPSPVPPAKFEVRCPIQPVQRLEEPNGSHVLHGVRGTCASLWSNAISRPLRGSASPPVEYFGPSFGGQGRFAS
jgi:hypothetical protein